MYALSLPEIVEKLERLTFTGDPAKRVRAGTTWARWAAAELIVGSPELALNNALRAMSKDARWWDLAVEIGQWCP